MHELLLFTRSILTDGQISFSFVHDSLYDGIAMAAAHGVSVVAFVKAYVFFSFFFLLLVEVKIRSCWYKWIEHRQRVKKIVCVCEARMRRKYNIPLVSALDRMKRITEQKQRKTLHFVASMLLLILSTKASSSLPLHSQ